MRGMIDIKRYLSFILAILMLLSGCSKKEEEGKDLEGGGKLIINKGNTTIRFVAEQSPSLYFTDNISASLMEFERIIYEPLFNFDEALNPIPVLATGYERIGTLQYSVELKKGIKWHSGDDFSARDVIYTINKLKESKSIYYQDVDKISYIDGVSNNKLIFTMKEPVVNFVGLLSFPIIRNNAIEEQNIFNGTGPYKLKESKNSTYTFIKNENWHKGEASDKTVVLTILKDKNASVYAFEANEADIITTSSMDISNNTPRWETFVQNYISNNLTFLGFNHTEDSVLSNAEVRCGISYLLDKEGIIKEDMYGQGTVVDVPVYPKAWFYNKSNNILEVKSDGNYLEGILKELGWVKKNGVYTKNFDSYESELTLSILVNKDNPEKVAIAESIKKTLEKNGIITKVKPVSYNDYIQKISYKDFSMFIGEISMPKTMDPTKLVGSGGNYFSYANEEMDKTLDLMRIAKTNEEVMKAFDEFTGLFKREMPFVPLFFRTESIVMTSNLSGFGMPNYYGAYQNAENWYFSKK